MPYPKTWTAKDIRMLHHIEDSSGGDKSMAAATVNAYKARSKKKGRSKKKRSRR